MKIKYHDHLPLYNLVVGVVRHISSLDRLHGFNAHILLHAFPLLVAQPSYLNDLGLHMVANCHSSLIAPWWWQGHQGYSDLNQ